VTASRSAREDTSSQEPTGNAAVADTSAQDAASNRVERKAEQEASKAEQTADEAGRNAEQADDAAEEVEERIEQAAAQVYGELAGLGAGGEGEAPVRAVELFGRVGLFGYGLVHVLIGVIAAQLALSGRGQPDQQGALGSLIGHPVGLAVIAVVVLGLIAFAVWQGLAAARGFRWTTGNTRFRKRVGAGAKTIAVLAVVGVGVRLLITGSSGGSSSAGSEQVTAGLLGLPAGRLLVALVGVVVLVVAGAMCYTGIARSFSDDLDYDRLPDRLRRPVEALGVAGHVARGLAFGVVGLLFGVAALRVDPGQAGGLDQALTTLAAQAYGPLLLLAIGFGFAAFGVFTFAESWARRI
jgi:hypothetical protein